MAGALASSCTAMRAWPALLLLLPACVTTARLAEPRGASSDPSEWASWPERGSWSPFPWHGGTGAEAARVASTLVGLRSVHLAGPRARRFPDDCTGVARYAWDAVGVDLYAGFTFAGENGVTAMHRAATDRGGLHLGAPRPGDLVFFRETYDRNRDGVLNDGLTHVGVVESADAEGSVTFIHRGGRGVQRAVMNLNAPALHRAGGRLLNDYIRPASKRGPALLTIELFAGFATPSIGQTPLAHRR